MKQEAKVFSAFINRLRKQKNISMERLCEGLCTPRVAWYLERGEREPDKLLQDRILERLGVGAEDYEHFLNYREYDRWESRTKILHCITHEKIERAELLLREYSVKYNMNDKLEKQFYLGVLAQIRRCQEASRKELADILGEAVRLTVPNAEGAVLKELVLSFQELNLILEAEQYRREGERLARYLEIIEYIEHIAPDRRSMAKIYPKAVYFLYRCTKNTEQLQSLKIENNFHTGKIYEYVERALDILRDNLRLYYMWEILDARGRLMEQLQKEYMQQDACEKADSMAILWKENNEWKNMLERLYEEFHIPKEMFEYCYIYVVKGVSCINDIIPIRRKMLGMTQQQLCGEFCDVRTLQRIEQRVVAPQYLTVNEYFQKLGLPTELTRTELVTEDAETRELMERLRIQVNGYNREEADRLIEEIKRRVPTEIRCNQQVLFEEEVLSLWDHGIITDEEYCKQMKMALELTLPFEAFLRPGKKYLTNSEQTCIQNMMLGMDKESEEYQICLQRLEELYQYYPENEMQEAVSSMYEFIMKYVGSALGNQGEFDEADKYSEIIVTECLRLRRLSSIADGLYDRWWNCKQRRLRDILPNRELDAEEELAKCIMLSNLGRKNYSKQFYEEKLAAERS